LTAYAHASEVAIKLSNQTSAAGEVWSKNNPNLRVGYLAKAGSPESCAVLPLGRVVPTADEAKECLKMLFRQPTAHEIAALWIHPLPALRPQSRVTEGRQ
jgi:hypothetical protein